jgi:hypothetical protein
MSHRKGVVGELLIIVVLMASVFLIVTTFTNDQDVPSVAKESLDGLRDVRAQMGRAILAWLQDGVTDETLMCNGLYPVDTSSLTNTLRPYVESELETLLPSEGVLQINPGALQSLDLEDAGLTITLADGTIIYEDGTIYAEDNFDKEYYFGVRLPLAIKVIEDWARCDAGNLSRNLHLAFGKECFFGKKVPGYGGGSGNVCLKPLSITKADRDYMLAKALTPEHVSRGVRESITELNSYFAGEASCVEPLLEDATGITCSFELEDMVFHNKIVPWSSEGIVKERSLDYNSFIKDDVHVYNLEPDMISYPFWDEQLGCEEEGREPVQPSINVLPFPEEGYGSKLVSLGTDFDDLTTGLRNSGFATANPVLYINTTRGAQFTLVVKCEDSRAAILGQPLEYTFRLQHGIRQHCGPGEMSGARHRCGACSPMVAVDASKCLKPSDPASCETYWSLCSKNVVWTHLRETGGSGDYMAVVGADDDLREEINESCGTVWGFESQYPRPLQDPESEERACRSAYQNVCCMMEGYEEKCADPHNINNPDCFFNYQDAVSLCYARSGCDGDECEIYKCDESTDMECQLRGYKNEGDGCGTGGCYTCQNTPGEEGRSCQFVQEPKPCSPGFGNDGCSTWLCDPTTTTCKGTTIPEKDNQVGVCNPYGGVPRCRESICKNGGCVTQDAGESSPCGLVEYTNTEGRVCDLPGQCTDGFCQAQGTNNCRGPPRSECNLPCTFSELTGCLCP